MKKNKLTANKKRKLLKQVFENTFGISIYPGSPIEAFIKTEFSRGKKSKLNDDLAIFYQTNDSNNFIKSIIKSMGEYDNLKEIKEYISELLPMVYQLIDIKNNHKVRRGALKQVINKSINSLSKIGLNDSSFEISKLKSVINNLEGPLELGALGKTIEILGKAIKNNKLYGLGNICSKLAPNMIVLGNDKLSISEKSDAILSSLSSISEFVDLKPLGLVSNSLRNILNLKYLNPLRTQCSSNLDDVLHKVGIPLGNKVISDIRYNLRDQGVKEQDICNAVNLITKDHKQCTDLISATRSNQKIAAASKLIFNISQDIKCKPLEKLSHASMSYSCISQIYNEVKYKKGDAISLGGSTGVLLQSVGSLFNNDQITNIGNSILSGVELTSMVSMIPGGAILAIPAGIIAGAANFLLGGKSSKQRKIEKEQLKLQKEILTNILKINKNIISLNEDMLKNFNQISGQLNQSTIKIINTINEGFNQIQSQISHEINNIEESLSDVSFKIDKISLKLDNKFKEMYENKVLSQIRFYEISKQINSKLEINDAKKIITKLIYWVQYQSEYDASLQKIEFNPNDLDNNYKNFNSFIDDENIDYLPVMGNLLKTDEVCSDLKAFNVPNISLLQSSIETILNIIDDYGHERMELDKSSIDNILTKKINYILEKIDYITSNHAIENKLLDNLTKAHAAIIDNINEFKVKNYYNPLQSLDVINNHENIRQDLIRKFSEVRLSGSIFGDSSYNLSINLSNIFDIEVFPNLVENTELIGKLNLLDVNLSILNSSKFFHNEYHCNSSQYRKREDILPLTLSADFYINNMNKHKVASITFEAFSGGIQNRLNYYRARYQTIPLQNTVCLVINGSQYKKYYLDGRKSTLETYKSSPTINELLMPRALDLINKSINESIDNNLYKVLSTNYKININKKVDSSDRFIFYNRINLIDKLEKDKALKSKLMQAKSYAKILNTIYYLNNKGETECVHDRFYQLLKYASLDINLNTDFNEMIKNINNVNIENNQSTLNNNYCNEINEFKNLINKIERQYTLNNTFTGGVQLFSHYASRLVYNSNNDSNTIEDIHIDEGHNNNNYQMILYNRY